MILLKILNEKMKKVLFLMLFLLVLGAASVKAQVRIGGNAAPQGAAVLDLNADNTISPAANKGGLSLPRVSLDSTTMKLNGIAPIAGTLVWNTNGSTLGGGICHWNGSTWVRTSLPATAPGDSGSFLMSNGKIWIRHSGWSSTTDTNILRIHVDSVPVKWTKILDTAIAISLQPYSVATVPAPGLYVNDWCVLSGRYAAAAYAGGGYISNQLVIVNWMNTVWNAINPKVQIRCFRPDR